MKLRALAVLFIRLMAVLIFVRSMAEVVQLNVKTPLHGGSVSIFSMIILPLVLAAGVALVLWLLAEAIAKLMFPTGGSDAELSIAINANDLLQLGIAWIGISTLVLAIPRLALLMGNFISFPQLTTPEGAPSVVGMTLLSNLIELILGCYLAFGSAHLIEVLRKLEIKQKAIEG